MSLFLFFMRKLFVFTFILACLYLVKEGVKLYRGLSTGQYELGKHTLLWVGICVVHIVTTLITGFII